MTIINAHRGDPLSFRENTMPAFESAVKLGADCMELDIRASLDEQAVVLHDETLERLWGITEYVSALSYDEILALTTDGDRYVPRLEEVLSSFKLPVMVDFVDDSAVYPIIRALVDCGATDRCLISSGNVSALKDIRRHLNDVAIALTWDDIIPPRADLLKELDVQYFNPYYRLYQDDFVRDMASQHDGAINVIQMSDIQEILARRHDHPEWYQHDALCGAHLVRRMHDAGIKTTAWTVDDSTTMREMINLGVDLITTNDICALMEVRNER